MATLADWVRLFEEEVAAAAEEEEAAFEEMARGAEAEFAAAAAAVEDEGVVCLFGCGFVGSGWLCCCRKAARKEDRK
jgi:threonine dehydrogenase-like Zn-dependent dehydrogenase